MKGKKCYLNSEELHGRQSRVRYDKIEFLGDLFLVIFRLKIKKRYIFSRIKCLIRVL
jgi:hypothetical protein